MSALVLDLDSVQNAMSGYGEPLDGFKWCIEALPVFGGLTVPKEYVLEASIPMPTFGSKQKQTAATVITLPDVGEISGFDLTLHEDQKGSSFNYIITWMEHVQNPHSGGYYLPFNYKRDLIVQLQNKKGEIAIRAKLKGCFPLSPTPITLTGGGGEVVKISCNMAVDAMIPLS